ncbi:hypothetical protein GCM10010377_40090 [Streptomyces viridiviolaceus]|nr:hypothetical protein GCM10010377_40090 [Streptomyces viridiviolaceus]
MDRRGYGRSPDTDGSDFETDADDLVDLLSKQDAGAHLVGHGNGGLAAVLAAGRRPDLVRSLTLIQPAAFSAAAGHLVVEAMLARVRDGAGVPESVTPEQYLRASTEGLGMTMPPLPRTASVPWPPPCGNARSGRRRFRWNRCGPPRGRRW